MVKRQVRPAAAVEQLQLQCVKLFGQSFSHVLLYKRLLCLARLAMTQRYVARAKDKHLSSALFSFCLTVHSP